MTNTKRAFVTTKMTATPTMKMPVRATPSREHSGCERRDPLLPWKLSRRRKKRGRKGKISSRRSRRSRSRKHTAHQHEHEEHLHLHLHQYSSGCNKQAHSCSTRERGRERSSGSQFSSALNQGKPKRNRGDLLRISHLHMRDIYMRVYIAHAQVGAQVAIRGKLHLWG